MNVTEFAEQIVFGKTLEDKLLVPPRLKFDKGIHAPDVTSLSSPLRPIGLEMRHDKGGNLKPPSEERLENENERGQLLHFLANHELLATELMALVLLKFPDAPYAFRQGVLVTLQEEQEHTRMYIRRMKECGVEFGQYPLSGQFWRIVEPMKSPMDFVSRLSLTFEQANLDYSLHFSNVFKKIGDLETAGVLQKIYEDEIGHVQHGLQWFRQWKNPEQTDWEAYQDSLEFPMSPNRGRGPRCSFNREGRIQAGLTEDFIDSIEVFRQSRGRPPVVYWFDPAAEVELAGNLAPRDAPLMDRLAKDLELVMVAIAKEDDVVLVRQTPSRDIRKQLIDVNFELPEFVTFDETDKLDSRLLQRSCPWAWTPSNHAIAGSLSPSAQEKPKVWNEKTTELYRKSFSTELLRNWLNEDQLPDWFSDSTCVGKPIFSFDDISNTLEELANRGFEFAIFKVDLAASGRGQRRLDCKNGINESDKNWLRSVFPKQPNSNGPVGVLEPELDRILDLSLLWNWHANTESPVFLGWTRPLVAKGRRYIGTHLGRSLFDCDESTKRFVLANRCEHLQQLTEWLQPRISEQLESMNFRGYFGVDAFVFKNPEGELNIKPMVELNPRMTMGHVALSLEKRLAPGAEAAFRIFSKGEWEQVAPPLQQLKLKCSRDGHWQSGFIPLAEVKPQTKLVPAIIIGKEGLALAEKELSGH
ncbi:MAG: DUF455 family protein [Mariniblastus sp.]